MTSAQDQNANYQKVKDMFENHYFFYLLHPDYTNEVNNVLTVYQREVFKAVSEGFYQCRTFNSGNMKQECVKKLLQSYEMEEINKMLNEMKKVKINSKPNNFTEALKSYEKIVHYYMKLVHELNSRSKNDKMKKMLEPFTDKEKQFIVGFISKWNYFLFFKSNVNAFIDIFAFYKTSDVSQQVFEKISKLKL